MHSAGLWGAEAAQGPCEGVMVVTKGGSRNRSGPQADPNSLRSAERKIVLNALPSEGYQGPAPAFPLGRRNVYRWESNEGVRYQAVDKEASDEVAEREADMWVWAWSTPQACAWALESWRWPIIAMWVRTFVVCESSEATAADKGSLHRFADQVGLTPAGLRENGWAIARDEISAKAAEKKTGAARISARSRMTVVDGGA